MACGSRPRCRRRRASRRPGSRQRRGRARARARGRAGALWDRGGRGMTLRRPEAALTVDGNRLTAAQAALVRLEVDLGVGRLHDRFRAVLGALSPLAGASAGQSAVVELGYGDNLEAVLTGTLTAIG